MKRALVATTCVGLVGACQAEEAPRVTYARDVAPIVERSCVRCHQEGNIGPFPLTTYDEVFAVKELVQASVESRSMPPWLASPDCEDYQHDPRLTDEEIATIAAWVSEGGPEGEASDGPATEQASEDDLSLERTDLTVRMDAPYTPSAESADDYRCFVMDWPEATTKFVTGFQVKPGNAAIVHHVIAYLAPPARADDVDEMDAAEPGAGYTCFGGPGFNDTEWLGAWAPGSPGSRYPDGTGLKVEPGSKVVLQVHYNTRAGAELSDQTAVDLMLEDTVEKEGFIFPFTNPLWLNGQNMLIPAGEANVSHAWDIRVGDFIDQPIVVHSANLHMHRLGVNGVTWIEREDESIDCLLDIPRWDFDWQMTYLFTEAKILYPEDRLGLECQYDNSPANQPVVDGERQEPRDVAWGEGTGDEMCLGILYVSLL